MHLEAFNTFWRHFCSLCQKICWSVLFSECSVQIHIYNHLTCWGLVRLTCCWVKYVAEGERWWFFTGAGVSQWAEWMGGTEPDAQSPHRVPLSAHQLYQTQRSLGCYTVTHINHPHTNDLVIFIDCFNVFKALQRVLHLLWRCKNGCFMERRQHKYKVSSFALLYNMLVFSYLPWHRDTITWVRAHT